MQICIAGILLMEYCAGRDLRAALGLTAADSTERLFGWHRRGRRVVLEVAKALNFLHARGVVHMDVKSNNVLLTSGGTAKLADVGLARLQTGTYLSDVPLIGTFAWVAPEVLMGGQGCTSAVDIFSLGVVMWEVITGERPQRGSLRAPRVPEECPQEVADLMMECLSLDPSHRPTVRTRAEYLAWCLLLVVVLAVLLCALWAAKACEVALHSLPPKPTGAGSATDAAAGGRARRVGRGSRWRAGSALRRRRPSQSPCEPIRAAAAPVWTEHGPEHPAARPDMI
jgi:serine/threonine protein kinase